MQTQDTSNSANICPAIEIRLVIFTLRDNRLHVLLQPLGGQHCLPGAPASAAKSLEECALESFRKATGRPQGYLEQLYTYSELPSGSAQRMVTVVYFALIPANALTSPLLDEEHPKWFPLDQIPPLFLNHDEIVQYALRRLRYKVEYTAVGFELLPDQFSLTELQHTYEVILGEKLDKRNFRRRILEKNIIEPAPLKKRGEGRPAQLFRYREDAVAEVKVRRLFP